MKLRKISSIVATLLLVIQMTFVFAETEVSEDDYVGVETTILNQEESNVDIEAFNKTINAEAYVVIDSSTGEKIMGKNENKVMYPASLTKIVTSLMLLESGKVDQMFTVSKEADAIGEASMYAAEGEQLSGKDLLYAMMLQSANDACYVVAEGVSGTANEFYELMTKRAHALGATSSNFTSANGLHEPDHVTTAMDLAIITKEVLKYDLFREAMGAKTYTLTRASESAMKNITNKNRMLFSEKPEYNQYAIGGKTAYTTPAGNCLMEIAKKDDMEIIVITMKSTTIYPDTNKIINFAFENFKSTPVIEQGDFVYEYKKTFLDLYTKEGVGYTIPSTQDASSIDISTEVVLSPLSNEISYDDKVGVINAYVNGELYKSVDVYAKGSYTFTTGVHLRFLRNIAIFVGVLVLIKIIANIYKMRKIKTQSYLKKSRFY